MRRGRLGAAVVVALAISACGVQAQSAPVPLTGVATPASGAPFPAPASSWQVTPAVPMPSTPQPTRPVSPSCAATTSPVAGDSAIPTAEVAPEPC